MSATKNPRRNPFDATTTPGVVPCTYGHDETVPTFSVAQYQRMIRAGVFAGDDQVELLDRYLVKKMSRNHPHDNCIACILYALLGVIPPGWHLRSQVTIELQNSQPEPDFMILRGQPRDYLGRHPGPADPGLIIEVADTSLARDQRDKSRIYAGAGIPAYWVVNLIDHRIEDHADPDADAPVPAYRRLTFFGRGESIPLMLDGRLVAEIPTEELLPEPAPGETP